MAARSPHTIGTSATRTTTHRSADSQAGDSVSSRPRAVTALLPHSAAVRTSAPYAWARGERAMRVMGAVSRRAAIPSNTSFSLGDTVEVSLANGAASPALLRGGRRDAQL